MIFVNLTNCLTKDGKFTNMSFLKLLDQHSSCLKAIIYNDDDISMESDILGLDDNSRLYYSTDYCKHPYVFNDSMVFVDAINYKSLGLDGLKALVQYGADPSQRNESGWTALHFAAKYGDFKLYEYLISMGMSIEQTTSPGFMLTMQVLSSGHDEVLQLLLEKIKRTKCWWEYTSSKYRCIEQKTL